MAFVWLTENGKRDMVMAGNYWDFHPGCHGIHEYGDFRGALSLAEAIKRTKTRQGVHLSIVTRTLSDDEYQIEFSGKSK